MSPPPSHYLHLLSPFHKPFQKSKFDFAFNFANRRLLHLAFTPGSPSPVDNHSRLPSDARRFQAGMQSSSSPHHHLTLSPTCCHALSSPQLFCHSVLFSLHDQGLFPLLTLLFLTSEQSSPHTVRTPYLTPGRVIQTDNFPNHSIATDKVLSPYLVEYTTFCFPRFVLRH